MIPNEIKTANYELRLEGFSGPIEKLLELIEERKMEISRLSLAEVTADFLKYIESLEEVTPKILADFIAVAAKLILVKSHTLLPELRLSEEEEKGITDLEDRLKLYQEFRHTEEYLRMRWQRKVAFTRDYLANLPPGFYLKEEVKPTELQREIGRLSQELMALSPEIKKDEMRLITLEEKISELMDRLDKAIKATFDNIAEGKERSEIIVLFLALLHLLKDALVKVEQDRLFADIRITRNKI